ncbi:MAG TPA: helix-turn-helix domain-containing protein [Baekduia sp.]|nr:helix-turn-helix domain-containing protein [Baekduia sp.]
MSSDEMTSTPKRTTRREKQALATRADILRAARELFAERGYSATSMADIAAAADVAVQTIYASCGSKRALVAALVDFIDEEADVPALAEQLRAEVDPRAAIAVTARLTRQIQERSGDVIRTLSSASAVEPAAAEAMAEGERRHRAGTAGLVAKLDAMGALKAGVSVERGAAQAALLFGGAIYEELVGNHGWSYDEVEAWVRETAGTLLLGDSVDPSG